MSERGRERESTVHAHERKRERKRVHAARAHTRQYTSNTIYTQYNTHTIQYTQQSTHNTIHTQHTHTREGESTRERASANEMQQPAVQTGAMLHKRHSPRQRIQNLNDKNFKL